MRIAGKTFVRGTAAACAAAVIVAIVTVGGCEYRREVCVVCRTMREGRGAGFRIGADVIRVVSGAVSYEESRAFALVFQGAGHTHEWGLYTRDFETLTSHAFAEHHIGLTELQRRFEHDGAFRADAMARVEAREFPLADLADALAYDPLTSKAAQPIRLGAYERIGKILHLRVPP